MDQTPQNLDLLKRFVSYVIQELKIETNCQIHFVFEHDPMYPSAGGYMAGQNMVVVAAKNRAIADVMRTLSHELTHHRQFELGMIGPQDTDNQKLEDVANIMSGRLVRQFGRENREIYGDLA